MNQPIKPPSQAYLMERHRVAISAISALQRQVALLELRIKALEPTPPQEMTMDLNTGQYVNPPEPHDNEGRTNDVDIEELMDL